MYNRFQRARKGEPDESIQTTIELHVEHTLTDARIHCSTKLYWN